MPSLPRSTHSLGKLIRKHRQLSARIEAAERKRDAELRRAPQVYGFANMGVFIAALRHANKVSDARGHRLTKRQRERMLADIKAGATPMSIAKKFRITPATAAYHVSRHAPKKQKS